MNSGMKLGSRTFEPRIFTTLVTLALLGLLLSLGRWQLHRAAEKRVLFDEFAAGTGAVTLDGATKRLARYQHVVANGHYDAAHQILIDNMVDADGHVGYFVVTPFALARGGWILVNRGWIPLGASRAAKPDVGVGENERAILGRTDELPKPGIRMGTPAPLAAPYPVVAAFPSLEDIGSLLQQRTWSRAAELVLLDAGETDGYQRRWTAPGLPPLRHIAYAVQWFALALALVVIYGVTHLKRKVPAMTAPTTPRVVPRVPPGPAK
jgi:surfeit locus 1 family protein